MDFWSPGVLIPGYLSYVVFVCFTIAMATNTTDMNALSNATRSTTLAPTTLGQKTLQPRPSTTIAAVADSGATTIAPTTKAPTTKAAIRTTPKILPTTTNTTLKVVAAKSAAVSTAITTAVTSTTTEATATTTEAKTTTTAAPAVTSTTTEATATTTEAKTTTTAAPAVTSTIAGTPPPPPPPPVCSDADMPPCPPPDSLHLLCDIDIDIKCVSCEKRAEIMNNCFIIFGELMYGESDWSVCYDASQGDECCEVIDFLVSRNLTTFTPQSCIPTTPVVVPPIYGNVTNVSMTTPIVYLTTTSPSSKNTTSEPVLPSPANGNTGAIFHTSLCYWCPVPGIIFIIIECIVLWYLLFYRRRKKRNPAYNHSYRKSSTGSMVLLEAETNPQTYSMVPGSPPETEKLDPAAGESTDIGINEDEKIFHSYLNLQFIDESSNDGTPERKLVSSK